MRGDLLALGATSVLALAGLLRRRGSANAAIGSADAALLVEVLAALRALSWSHWTTHWQARGQSFYGDHLLFERLYKDPIEAEIDGTAERIVAYAGASAVDAAAVGRRSQEYLNVWAAETCPYRRALVAERELQKAIRSAHTGLKSSGALSLGLDDWLMTMASAHDTNVYLIQQRLAG